MLRFGMSWLALDDMPLFQGYQKPREIERCLEEIQAAGYDGVQFDVEFTREQLSSCRRVGLDMIGSARVNVPIEMGAIAERLAGEGFACATLHVGWGTEGPEDAARLIEAVLEASERFGIPLYIETHRATIFQDIWRTVDFVGKFPGVRINGDFSHWYTGQEFVYGDFQAKMEFIEPVLERVRFLHGRIGNPGCMQVDIGDANENEHPYVAHFRALWTRSMEHFLRHCAPGDCLYFVPELLSPRIYYGRVFRDARGELREESDRWEQSLILRNLAHQCFAMAQESLCMPDSRLTHSNFV